MLKRLMLVRHGEAVSNEARFFGGWKDVPLTELGILQAQWLSKRLKKEKFDKIFCSDLKRAKDTLELSGIKGSVVFTKNLREKNYGKLEGKTWKGKPPYYSYHLDPFIRAPGGESCVDVQQRVVKYYLGEIDSGRYGDVLVVSHHGPIVLLSCYLLGIKLDNWRNLRLGNAGISIFERDGKRMRLTLWNSLSHYGLETEQALL